MIIYCYGTLMFRRQKQQFLQSAILRIIYAPGNAQLMEHKIRF